MSDRLDFIVKTKEDLIDAVHRVGFLPLFRNSIPGFSVEDHVDLSVWLTGDPGVWEWKGPVIQEAGCAYGKFFENKAAFISAEWFPDFANYRRDGYDFDARFDDELASYKDKQLFELLDARAPVLSKTLKRDGKRLIEQDGCSQPARGAGRVQQSCKNPYAPVRIKKGGATGFDTSINRLQAQGYVIISNFVYLKDRHGKEYGWGVAEYSTPEKFFGDAFKSAVYQRDPAESYQRMLDYFHEILPDVPDKALRKFLR